MADNNGFELAGKKGKEAKKAAAAAKAKRNAEIAQMRDLVQKIFNSGSPAQYEEVKRTTMAALKSMGVNVSDFERREESHQAYLRAEAAKAELKSKRNAQMAKNKEKVEKHFGPLAGHRVNMMRHRLETRWMGQKMTPSNANIYAELVKDVNRNVAYREAANRQSAKFFRESMEREYPEWYNMKPSRRAPPPRYTARNYGNAADGYSDEYGSAAQGGPAPRNNWQSRAARGAYEEWKPAPPAPVEPAMYPMLGVPITASERNIKKAYREKALIYHPNKGGDPEDFKKLQREYETALASLGAEGGRRRTRRSHHKRSKTRKNRS